MNKNLFYAAMGILGGYILSQVGYQLVGKDLEQKHQATGAVQHEQVILGHRIGPGGQEMLVVAK